MRQTIEDRATDEGGRAIGESATTGFEPVHATGPTGGSGRPAGSAPGAGRHGRVGRRAAIVATAAVLAVGGALWAHDGGGGHGEAEAPTPASERPPTTAERDASPVPASTATPGESPAPAARTEPTDEAQTGEAVLGDGHHPVFLTGIDVPGSTVEFDLVRYLTGDEARAYAEAHEDEYGDDYLDQFIVNENPRLRRLPVASDVQVTVLRTAESTNSPHVITFAELPAYADRDVCPTDPLGCNAFWLTVRGGSVVAIDEQYSA